MHTLVKMEDDVRWFGRDYRLRMTRRSWFPAGVYLITGCELSVYVRQELSEQYGARIVVTGVLRGQVQPQRLTGPTTGPESRHVARRGCSKRRPSQSVLLATTIADING